MKKLIGLLGVLICMTALSQNDSINKDTKKVSEVYFIDKTDMLILKPYLAYKLNSIEVQNKGSYLTLTPNSPMAIGLGINYKWIGVSLGIGLPQSKASIDKKGKTDQFDIQAGFYSSRIGGDGYLQLYKGYYNANPQDFIPWEENKFPQNPEMKTISFGGNLYYVFNHKKFSNKAFYSRSQIQTKSAGSFSAGYFLNYDEVESPNGFIPSEFPDTIATDLDIKAYRYFATGFSIGYLYTWVISKNFFVNTIIQPGFGYKNLKLSNSQGEQKAKQQPHVQLILRINLGYESKYFFAGLSGNTLIRNMKYDDYQINMATEQIRFYLGYRLRVKKEKNRL